MVNKTVFEYFRKNRGRYPIEALKKKALAAGYTKQDVDDAAVMSGKPEGDASKEGAASNEQKKPSVNFSGFTKKSSSSIGWMKLAGTFGILFFILYLALITAGVYFQVELARYFSVWLVGLVSLLSCVFLYGFVRLSTHTESKLLKISSYTRIGLALTFIALYAMLRPTFLDNNLGPGSVLVGLCFAYAIIYITTKYTFAISLVKIGKKVRFIKVVGILTLTYTTLITLSLIYIAYLFFAAGTLNLDITTLTILYWAFVITEIFMISSLFFESIALYFAHGRYE